MTTDKTPEDAGADGCVRHPLDACPDLLATLIGAAADPSTGEVVPELKKPRIVDHTPLGD